jgi:hypothetical protein
MLADDPQDVDVIEAAYSKRINFKQEAAPTEASKLDDKDLSTLIKSGENQIVEFKQSLRVDIKTHEINNDLEWECIKTIAAFLNTKGGTLLIGIRDNDSIVVGLEDDFNSFPKENKRMHFFCILIGLSKLI